MSRCFGFTKIASVWLGVLLTFSVLCASVSPAAAQVTARSQDQLQRADALALEGDYFRAISEYKRFLAMTPPSDPRHPQVRMRVAWIYHAAGKGDLASTVLRQVAMDLGDTPEGWMSRLHLGQALLKSKNAAAGRNALERLVADCEASSEEVCTKIKTESRLALAGYFATVFQWEAAASQLALVPPKTNASKSAYKVSDYLRTLEIPTKSPTTAGVLSIIPGLGHAYLEDYSVAVMALVWNGVFIAATVDAAVDADWGQTALFGMLELIWYSGTIYSAVAGAHRFNRDASLMVRDGLIRDVRALDDDTPWGAGAAEPDVQLNFTW